MTRLCSTRCFAGLCGTAALGSHEWDFSGGRHRSGRRRWFEASDLGLILLQDRNIVVPVRTAVDGLSFERSCAQYEHRAGEIALSIEILEDHGTGLGDGHEPTVTRRERNLSRELPKLDFALYEALRADSFT